MATCDRAPTTLPIATAITLLAALLRFLYLGHDSLWFDEVLTRGTAVASLASPAAALAVRDHVPLLYWLTALVLRVLPEHEVTLRLVPALAGVLAVPLLLAFGRAARLPVAGRWAALLLAVSPFHIRYSQEARHYALLLFFSLLALYWLYRATAASARGDGRAGRTWLAFAAATVANLLTHYSAWLWLAGQGVAVALWLAWRARRGDRRAVLPALPAALVVGAAVLLLLGRATDALRANTGGAAGTTAAAALPVWLRALWLEFGFFRPLPAAALALLTVGVVVALRRRPWLAVLLAVCAIVPVGLIQALAITRFALPKYVIYLLPLYLFAAGAGIDAALALVRWPRTRTAAGAAVAAAVLLVAAPAVVAQYRQMVHDWRGAAAQLGPAAPGDVVLTIALDTGDGFNAAGVVAPIYLDPGFRLLDGNHLTAGELVALAGARGRVSALALNLYAPVVAAAGGWTASHHVSSLFALRRGDTTDVLGDDVLDQLAALYAQLIPQAIPPAQCALWPVLAQTHLARGDAGAASAALAARSPDCPADAAAREAQTAVLRAELAAAQAAGDVAAADRAAAALLALDPGDAGALAVLTVVDVLAWLGDGRLAVRAANSPEPVEARQFVMPDSGEAGEVVFAHPPAAVAFTTALPDAPAVLRFRAALDPQSWGWGGDGVTFVVTVQTAGAPAQELARFHLANDATGRGWHAVELPLDAFAGQTVTITLATETGPAGDGTGDWAGWGEPRVVRRID